MKHLLIFASVFYSTIIIAQFNFVERENELSILLDSLRSSKNDDAKNRWNNEFKSLLESTLKEPTIFEQQFTKLSTLGVISSPDNLMKIVNWNVEQEDQSQKYYCFVLQKDERKNTHKVVELIDNSFMLPGKPEDVLDENNWYGALYYQIIPFERNSKKSYIVLGWDGGLTSSNTKLIDVITFTGNGVKLGQSIFKTGDQTLKRVFFEHSEKTVMSLRYEEEYNRIIFDHLSPETPSMTGFYEYYVPDMSYDAFILNGSKWVLAEDVIGISKLAKTVKKNTFNPETGEVIEEEVENKWTDPTSESPAGSKEVHVATLPDEAIEGSESNSTEKTPKKKKEDMTALEKWELKKRHKEKQPENSILPETKKKKRR
jgi:hypothetical protein